MCPPALETPSGRGGVRTDAVQVSIRRDRPNGRHIPVWRRDDAPIPERSTSPWATSTLQRLDSLKALDPSRPIREADIGGCAAPPLRANNKHQASASASKACPPRTQQLQWRIRAILGRRPSVPPGPPSLYLQRPDRVSANSTWGVECHGLMALARVVPVLMQVLAGNANCAPAGGAADLTFRGSGHTDTINSCPTHSASDGDLRSYAIQLRKRRGRHGLRRCCDG